MQSSILFAPTISEVQTGPIEGHGPNGVTVVLASSSGDLTGTEAVVIEYTTDSGVTWKLLSINGVVQKLSSSASALALLLPLVFRVNKPVTSNLVSIALIQ